MKLRSAFLLLALAPAARAEITADSLTFKNLARQASDEAQGARFAEADLRMEAAGFRREYEANLYLTQNDAGSHFELQHSMMSMITQEFKAALAAEAVLDAETRQSVWDARATAAETGGPEPLAQIAGKFVRIRERKIDVAEKLLDWAQKLAEATHDLRERSDWLYERDGEMVFDRDYYATLEDVAQAAVNDARTILAAQRRHLAAAEADLRQVGQR